MSGLASQEYLIPISLLALYIRICISFGPHSGQGQHPKFGDYEAQRHWQEITVNLPVSDWYRNTTDNDLLYWGLDYPPLSALHSAALGHLAKGVNTSWVDLHGSRGEESYSHKLYMRLSVLFSEVVHLSPLFLLVCPCHPAVLLLLAITPAQPLVDHGHFQYNGVSLGLTLAAVLALRQGWVCGGSVLFSLALNYKQMSLYHALPFFFYILGPRYNSWHGWRELVKVGLTVTLTFLLCWAPFLPTAGDVIVRLFPFNRGLFEDKVANFWCSVSVVLKVKDMFERITLVRAALFLTLLSVLPSQLLLFRNSSHRKFILALTNSALGFFLFSFHVHEKTIIIPLSTVMLLHKHTDKHTDTPYLDIPSIWFTTVAVFSMYPLLQRDGLSEMYVASMGLYLTVAWVLVKNAVINQTCKVVRLQACGVAISCVGCAALHLLEVLVDPPVRYPFLFPTLNALYSSAHFAAFFCYFNYRQIVD